VTYFQGGDFPGLWPFPEGKKGLKVKNDLLRRSEKEKINLYNVVVNKFSLVFIIIIE
jgi:hypothetical protein